MLKTIVKVIFEKDRKRSRGRTATMTKIALRDVRPDIDTADVIDVMSTILPDIFDRAIGFKLMVVDSGKIVRRRATMMIDRVEECRSDGGIRKIARFSGAERWYRARALARAKAHREKRKANAAQTRSLIERSLAGRQVLGERTKSENSVYISRRPSSIKAVHTSLAAVGRAA